MSKKIRSLYTQNTPEAKTTSCGTKISIRKMYQERPDVNTRRDLDRVVNEH
jgi:hypothetical protein